MTDEADKDFLDYFNDRKDTKFEAYASLKPWNYYFAIERIKETFKDKLVSILDVGCADGLFRHTIKIEKLNHVYEGVDYSGMARKEFKKHFKDKLHSGIDKVEFKYDVVTCLQTLEHVERPDKFIKKLFSKVKKGGLLIITVPIENRIPAKFHQSSFNHYHIQALAESCKPKDFGIYYINRDNKYTGKLNCFGLVLAK